MAKKGFAVGSLLGHGFCGLMQKLYHKCQKTLNFGGSGKSLGGRCRMVEKKSLPAVNFKFNDTA